MSTLDRWYAMKQERDTLRRAQRNLTNSYNALSQQLAEVRTELASHAWTVSPAMADAQIHQLNLKIIGLEETIAIHTACATALKQQLASMTLERDLLNRDTHALRAEIEDWRKKKKGKP